VFYTYVLRSRIDKKLYIGHSSDVNKRLIEHNFGKVQSTKYRRPFDLLYFKEFMTQSEARWQERQWKSAWGHKQLNKILQISLV